MNTSVRLAQKVHFAHGDTLMSQDCVGSGQMEVEVRQRKRQQVACRRELELSSSRLQDHFGLLLAIHARFLHAFEEVDSFLNSCLQIRERLLVIFHADRLNTGNTHSGTFGGIADSLNLVGQREHVFDKPGLQELFVRNAFLVGISFALFEYSGEIIKAAEENRNADLVERNSHG